MSIIDKKPKNEMLNDITTDMLDYIVKSCNTINKIQNTNPNPKTYPSLGSVFMNLCLLDSYTTEIRDLLKLDLLYGEYEFKENRESRKLPLPSNFMEKLNEITEEEL